MTLDATPKRAAIWCRVSTDEQETDNQLKALTAWAERRGFTVVRTFTANASAFQGAHLRLLSEVTESAHRGEFTYLLVWALDRLSRQGALSTLEIVHRLGSRGVTICSLQEPWVESSGEIRDMLIAVAGWVAQMESKRQSERTKAGMDRARSQGKRVGRPPGSKDTVKRKKTGYLARHDPDFADRAAATARRKVNASTTARE